MTILESSNSNDRICIFWQDMKICEKNIYNYKDKLTL